MRPREKAELVPDPVYEENEVSSEDQMRVLQTGDTAGWDAAAGSGREAYLELEQTITKQR